MLLFSFVSNFDNLKKKIVFFVFIFYHILYFSLDALKIVELENISHLSYEDKMIKGLPVYIAIAAKCGWIFFILSLINDNIKKYLYNASFFIIVSLILSYFGMITFIYVYTLSGLLLIIPSIRNKILNNEHLMYIIKNSLYFITAYLLLEFLITLNIVVLSANLLPLIGFYNDNNSIKELLSENPSFILLNYIFKENLVGFNDGIYLKNGYTESITMKFLYTVNIVRDNLSFLFLLVVCFFRNKSYYIVKTYKTFLLLSIVLFIINFLYFIIKDEKNADTFIKISYNIFIYYILYLSIEFKIINSDLIKKILYI
jgi:hypothetical protein